MKFAMCNEFCDGWPLEDALKLARDTGYHGVEVAPYTLADDVRDIPMSAVTTCAPPRRRQACKSLGCTGFL